MSKVYVFMDSAPVEGGPLNKREVFWKQNCLGGYYDKSLQRTFSSKQEMRAYLATHKMRDAGERVDPNKPVQGRAKTPTDPQRQQQIKQYIQSCGGTEGLLKRMREQRDRYV